MIQKFAGYWSHQYHEFGQCHANLDRDFIYVNIPKNASSWTKQQLEALDFTQQNYYVNNLSDHPAVVVLRDPVDRWISGIAEYFTRYYHRNSPADLNSFTIDIIFNHITFDPHTEKQLYFIQDLDPSKIVYFWFDDDYRRQFGKFLTEQGIRNTATDSEPAWWSGHNPVKQAEWKEFFQQQLKNNSKYQDQIHRHFNQDYELIESANFYDPR
jgi:hypothetical protein